MTSAPQQTNTTSQPDTTSASQSSAYARSSPSVSANLSSAPAPISGRSSYASATKGSFPPNASEPSNMSTAVGGAPPADAISPVNGRNPTIPAVPSVGGPTIVNGNSDHSRKPSFTVTPSSTNGGAVGGGQNKANNIQFGSMNAGGSPALNNPPALASQSSSNLGVAPQNPRVTSPQTSPSPIPQPAVSGGRPPSGLQGQGNGLSFGQIAAPNDANVCLPQLVKALPLILFRSICDQCPRALVHNTFAETLPNPHTARWGTKECPQVLEEEVIKCSQAVVAEVSEASTILT